MNVSSNPNTEKSPTTAALIYNLCCRITKLSGSNVARPYQYAIGILGYGDVQHSDGDLDEFATVELIQKWLVKEQRVKDVLLFNELHRKLQNSPLLRNRSSVLQLMLHLSSGKNNPTSNNGPLKPALQNVSPVFQNKNSPYRTMHGGLSKAALEILCAKNEPDLLYLPVIESHQLKVEMALKKQSDEKLATQFSPARANRVARITALLADKEKCNKPESNVSPIKTEKAAPVAQANRKSVKRVEDLPTVDVSDNQLLRELLYVFQGIDGKLIKRDSPMGVFYLDPHLKLSGSIKELVMRLSYLGWMFTQVNSFCETKSKNKSFGLVGQNFVAAVQEQIKEYYRLLAVMESQLQQNSHPNMSLRRLMVWCLDPFVRMKYLSAMVQACQDLQGGALASAIHNFLHHGDPIVQGLVKHILGTVVQPILKMLKSWIFNGELEDPHEEFFVASNSSSLDQSSLWYEKYSLRKAMIPSFLTMEESKKILSAGKAINFLRHVCKDSTEFLGANWLSKDANLAESLFATDRESEFKGLLDKTYSDISKHVLTVLHDQFQFMEHLKAMRRYLLLGQGDFIRHLMDLLSSELSKPASQVQIHSLSSILECAIRSTNAQFDSVEILQRLDVKLAEVQEGETGWDVFQLDYHIDGPIGTIITPNCQVSYLKLFNNLFRAKRMEYGLSETWKVQVTRVQGMREFPEVKSLLHHFQLLLVEMIHFMQQIQYYFAFEVMECSWAELQNKVLEAKDLDQMILAHEEFLDRIQNQSLLDDNSEVLKNRLRQIYDAIFSFQALHKEFWSKANLELEARAKRRAEIEKNSENGKWGTGIAQNEIDEARHREFVEQFIPKTTMHFRIQARHYHEIVHFFLKMLMDSEDTNLRFLGFRLDFNEHYKKENLGLQTSMTFQHRRKSMRS